MSSRCAASLAGLMLIVAPASAAAMSAPFVLVFGHGSAELSTRALNILVLAEQARSQGGSAIILSGYADASGPEWHNEDLSLRRAVAVREALVRLGTPRACLAVEAFGEERPLVETPNGVKEAVNRRVELTLAPPASLAGC